MEQHVLDASEARIHAAFQHDDVARLVRLEHRHAVDRAAGIVAGRRVDHVVRADHKHHVGVLEVLVDAVHLEQCLVRHVRLGEQHVHVPRHAPGHGVDRVADADAAILERLGQLARGVLRLRDREAVPWHDDDIAGVGEHHGRIVGGGCLDRQRLAGARCAATAAGLELAERAEDDVGERAIHRSCHQHTEEDARRTDQGAGDDQRLVVEREAGQHAADTRCRVQQRDHDGHVSAADREHQRHADHERKQEEHDHQALVGRAVAEDEDDHPENEDHREHRGIVELLVGVDDRPAGDDALQLGEGDQRAGQRDRADECAEDDRDLLAAADRVAVEKLADRNERRGATAETVEDRDHLRHLRHLDAFRREIAGSAADDDGQHDPDDRVKNALDEEGREDRQPHAGHRQQVAVAGGARRAELPDREDQQEGRDQVADIDKCLSSIVDHVTTPSPRWCHGPAAA